MHRASRRARWSRRGIFVLCCVVLFDSKFSLLRFCFELNFEGCQFYDVEVLGLAESKPSARRFLVHNYGGVQWPVVHHMFDNNDAFVNGSGRCFAHQADCAIDGRRPSCIIRVSLPAVFFGSGSESAHCSNGPR